MADTETSLAKRERAALVECFRRVGPDAPTLCEGWTTRDLAAHLVVRESRLDVAAGILVPALAARLEAARVREAERPWDELVDSVAAGAPWYSPFRFADSVANAAEYLVHHEDVLRAAGEWTPRTFRGRDLDRIWSLATTAARTALFRAPVRVEMVTPPGVVLESGKAVTAGSKVAPVVTVMAEPVELLLWALGREQVTVDISGPQSGVDIVRETSRGL